MKKLVPALAVVGAVTALTAGGALAARSHPTAHHAPQTKAAAHAQILRLTALKNGLAYNTKILNAKPGSVTIRLTNNSPLKHDVVVSSGKKVLARTSLLTKGQTGSLSVTLAKGSYTFYCSVPGHQAAGMKGTLRVK